MNLEQENISLKEQLKKLQKEKNSSEEEFKKKQTKFNQEVKALEDMNKNLQEKV